MDKQVINRRQVTFALTAGLFTGAWSPQAQAAACPALLQQSFLRLQDETPQTLCQFEGKVLLVVNTASYCGFTHQYQALEALHADYAAKGLVVVGFPSNNFGQQEPGSNAQIAAFCQNTFGVKFPMMAKTEVVGRDAHPFFKTLAQRTGSAPRWNFHKYLISRNTAEVKAYPSAVEPNDARLLRDLHTMLKES